MRPRTVVDTNTGRVRRTPVVRDTPCGKNGYTSRKLAAAVAKRASKQTGETIEAYRCPHGCHVWHVGHPPGYARMRRMREAS